MSFCSFTKESAKASITSVSNAFITEFLPDVDGDAAKVYLYGLYLCQNTSDEISVEEFASTLYMSEEHVIDYFLFWEEFGLVTVISKAPLNVKYLSLQNKSKSRKFKPEKYNEFNKAIQQLITERMITTAEYTEYFSIMEDYSIKPEAMLMLVNYCVEQKGAAIGYRYITTVARDFASREITTVEAIERELSDYTTRSGEIQTIVSAIGLKRKPDIDDLKLFNKWRLEMQFDMDSIIFAAKAVKARSMDKLDGFLSKLYQNKRFSLKEISAYQKEKADLDDTAKSVARELGVYCSLIAPFVSNYIAPWKAMGYDSETLIYIGKYCFKKKRTSFQLMDETVKFFFSNGFVTINSIADYISRITKDDDFIRELFKRAALDRTPTEWDRKNLYQWREWGFNNEMLLEAAAISAETSRPMVYMNSVLSNWKTQNIYSIDKIPTKPESGIKKAKTAPLFGTERKYSQEELDNLLDDISTINLSGGGNK